MAKILLIDDDSVLLRLYSTRLVADGHEVKTSTNGEEGLKVMAIFKPEIIVLDLLMPKLNGFAFLETLNKHPIYAKTKRLVFSSVANQEQIKRLETLGVAGFLNKIETTPTQLVQIINSLVSTPPT